MFQIQDSLGSITEFDLGLGAIVDFCARTVLVALISMVCLPMAKVMGQTYPTFPNYTTSFNGATFNTDYGPSMTLWPAVPNTMYMAFSSASNKDLTIMQTSDGYTWYGPNDTGINIGDISPSITAFNNKLYVAYNPITGAGTTPYITYSSDGSGWAAPQSFLPCGYGVLKYTKPAIFGYNGFLYIAFAEASSKNIMIGFSTDGLNFTNCMAATTAPSSYLAGSAPVMTSFTNPSGQTVLALTWFQASSHTVVVATVNPWDSSYGFSPATVALAPMQAINDPAIIAVKGNLFVFGRAVSGNKLWMVGSYDGVNFEAATQPGQQVGGSPAVGYLPGTFFEVAKSCCNSVPWDYFGPY